jgi:3-oxoacyl-[acyl-carrier protein] reductase
MIAAVTNQLGEVSILVNNAGIARPKRLDDVDATFDEAINVNLRSAFLVTSAICPRCDATSGAG